MTTEDAKVILKNWQEYAKAGTRKTKRGYVLWSKHSIVHFIDELLNAQSLLAASEQRERDEHYGIREWKIDLGVIFDKHRSKNLNDPRNFKMMENEVEKFFDSFLHPKQSLPSNLPQNDN